MHINESLRELLELLLERLNLSIDRELTVGEAAFLRGISLSAMRKRVNCVPAWQEAFFVSGTSKELRTTIRRMRMAEDKLRLLAK